MLQYDPLDVRRSEIRLFDLLPDKKDAPLHGRMRTVSLDDAPAYEAISYVWGEPLEEEKRAITVNGVPHAINPGLYAALLEFRRRRRVRVLWVDALCINQDDVPEKNNQVPQMARIYKTARRVLVWLGAMPVRTAWMLGWLQAYTARRPGAGAWPVTQVALRWLWLDLRAPLSRRARQERILHIIQMPAGYWTLRDNPYWSRMWTFQEFHLPPVEPTCCCSGGWRFQVTRLLDSAGEERLTAEVQGVLLRLSRQLREGRARDLDAAFEDRLLEETRWQPGRSPDNIGFLSELRHSADLSLPFLLLATSDRKCADPRDRIFALYGIQPELQAVCPPDYARPVDDVLHDVTAYTVRHKNGPSIWRLFPVRHSHLTDSNCPSWVPDYTANLPGLHGTIAPALRIPKDTPPPTPLAPDYRTLVLWGRSAGPCRVLLRFEQDADAVLAQLQDWLCRLTDDRQEPGLYQRVFQALSRWLAYYETHPVATEKTLAGEIMEGADARDVHRALQNLAGLVLFTSIDFACLGLACADMRNGDELVVSPHVSLPLVLKQEWPADSQAQGRYRMVGVAWVDGIMQEPSLNKNVISEIVCRQLTEFSVW